MEENKFEQSICVFLQWSGDKTTTDIILNYTRNGVIEWFNWTFPDKARSMMVELKIPNHLWTKTIKTTIYIKNRCPTHSNSKITPIKRFSGVKLLSLFCVFGCKVYIPILNHEWDKLLSHAFDGIMVGYDEQSKVYKYYEDQKENHLEHGCYIWWNKILWAIPHVVDP